MWFPRATEHAKVDYIRPCTTLSDCVSCPRVLMACHAQCRPTIVLTKDFDGMSCLPLFERVCCPRATRACNGPSSSDLVCAVKGRRWHAMPDVVRLCAIKVQRRHATLNVARSYVLSKSYAGRPCLTSFDRVWCPREMMVCHARRRLTVCSV